jgi:hypothetical protein
MVVWDSSSSQPFRWSSPGVGSSCSVTAWACGVCCWRWRLGGHVFSFAALASASFPSFAFSVGDGVGVVVYAKRLTAVTGRIG